MKLWNKRTLFCDTDMAIIARNRWRKTPHVRISEYSQVWVEPPTHRRLVPVFFLILTMMTLSAYMTEIDARFRRFRVPTPTEIQTEIRTVHEQETPQNMSIKTHLGFLKVHKAASTTTQAIFLRFGWRRNLTFVLPPEYNAFGYPNVISVNESVTKYNTLPPPPGKTFDILSHHVVYDQTAWGSVLPDDMIVIGTVREPFRLFKSVLNYFNPMYIRRIVSEDPIKEYLTNSQKYDPKPMSWSLTNNRLAFEYGVSTDIIGKKDVGAFDNYLKNVLNKTFAVVILAERFDESLVLMKRKLNWDMNDIMYALKNVRSVNKPDNFRVDETHRELHRKACPFDYLLYEFFEKKLNQQIVAEGPSFDDEVKHFQEARSYVENFCHSAPISVEAVKIAKSIWNEEFEMSRVDCQVLHRGEIPFTQDIRKRQYGSATWHW